MRENRLKRNIVCLCGTFNFSFLIFNLLLCALLFALCLSAEAQQPRKVPRLGWLASPGVTPDFYSAFRQGLQELGYVKGKNIVIEHRQAEKTDQLPSLAAELVRLKVDVIFASGGSQSALAAKSATTTIPIVMSNVDDPVAFGLVASLARPGGNITGLSATPGLGLEGKRLELLKESFPKISRLAALWNPNHPFALRFKTEYEAAAQPLGIKVQSLQMRDPTDLEQAFSAAKRDRAEVLVTINSPLVTSQLKRIVELAAKNRLPTMHQENRWVEAGGLMSYGTSYFDLYRRAATYVDKILKGTQPADLPVEQPTKFELVINLKTAKQIGVTIPPNVVARADKVIK
ncbi:MAG TPA: ABC transporter substrate-binding protein [Candidatus Binatia bacterium]|nr:ABC transporter substrate-binding protein [Candidatus Binatia bacterium]